MIEEKLTNLKKHVALSAPEKADVRHRLLSHIRMERAKPVPSPYSWMAFTYTRSLVAGLFIVVLSGGGVVAASEKAAPGNPLYAIKLIVTEPTRIAFARDRKEKAELEVSYAEDRLQELATASRAQTLDEGTTRLIASSLEDRIEGAEGEISALNAEGEGEEAYSANTELQGVLSAHAKILKKVAGESPAIAAISMQLEESITASEAAEPAFAAALESQEERGVLRASLETRQEEVVLSIQDLQADMVTASTTLDVEDHESLAQSLTEVTAILENASREQSEGSSKEALKLYSSADAKLGELKTLIEAEQELGLDLID